MITAGACILIAAVFIFRGEFNAAFVAAVIGLVSWFLNYRAQVSHSLTAEEMRQDDDQNGGDNSDED
jgi:hypothetical protein